MGAAVAPAHGRTFKELCSRADHALYRAKRQGKDGWSVFDGDPNGG